MTSHKGGRLDNPVILDDSEEDIQEIRDIQWTSTRAPNKSAAPRKTEYLALDSDDDDFKELPPGQIPAGAFDKHDRRNARPNPRAAPFATGFAVRSRYKRTPDVDLTLDGDDEPAAAAQSASPRNVPGETSLRLNSPSSAADGPAEEAQALGTLVPGRTHNPAPAAVTALALVDEWPAQPEKHNVTPRARDSEPHLNHNVRAGSDPQLQPAPDQPSSISMLVPDPSRVRPESILQGPVDAPIGARAEREQANPRQVEPNATSNSTRVSSTTVAEKDVAADAPNRSRSGSSARTSRPTQKPRMVKRAISPPRPKPPPIEHNSQHSLERPAQSARSLGERSTGREPASIPNHGDVPRIDRQSNDFRTRMGAQVSATASASSNEISKGMREETSLASPEGEPTGVTQNSVEIADEPTSPFAVAASDPNVNDEHIGKSTTIPKLIAS